MSVAEAAHRPDRRGRGASLWLGFLLVIAAGVGLAWLGAHSVRQRTVQVETLQAGRGPTIQPQDGVLIKHGSLRSDRIGVHTGDVFVAVDGVRVRSYAQYELVWRLSNDQRVTLTVWRDGRYRQLLLNVPQRWFGVAFDSYRPQIGRAE